MSVFEAAILAAHFFLLSDNACVCSVCTVCLWCSGGFRYRNHTPARTHRNQFEELPAVTVQIPVFNEQYVAERVLFMPPAALNYPAGKLQIQIVDDSTDETRLIC